MISFSPLLRRTPHEAEGHALPAGNVAAKALRVLMNGVAMNTPPSATDELESFLESVAYLSRELEGEVTPERVLIVAEAAGRAVADHSRAATEYVAERERELEEMRRIVDLLAGALSRAGLVKDDAARKIEAILGAESIRNAGMTAPHAGELAALRERLGECLEESVRLTRTPIAHVGEVDPLTRLHGPNAALASLAAHWHDREELSAVVFGIDRLASIGARFGAGVADELLRALSTHLADNLGPGDYLFRWRGPHLIALIRREISLGMPQMELARLAAAWRGERAVQFRNREALLTVSLFWEAFALRDYPGLEDLLASVSSLVSLRSPASTMTGRVPSAAA